MFKKTWEEIKTDAKDRVRWRILVEAHVPWRNDGMLYIYIYIYIYIHSFSIQPLGQFGRNQSSVRWPVWLWHAASLTNFLGVGCHYFPPLSDVPTFAARCLHVRNDARDPNSQRWNCGRDCCPVILPKWRFPRHLGIFYMPQIYDIGRRAEDFFALKNPTASARFEPTNLGTKGQQATPRPPKPLYTGCPTS